MGDVLRMQCATCFACARIFTGTDGVARRLADARPRRHTQRVTTETGAPTIWSVEQRNPGRTLGPRSARRALVGPPGWSTFFFVACCFPQGWFGSGPITAGRQPAAIAVRTSEMLPSF